MRVPLHRPAALVLLTAVLAACGVEGHDHIAGPKGDGTSGGASAHVHEAPRGGTLVVLAEETAHLEILHDTATGRLTVYLLGPHASNAVRTAQEALSVELVVGGATHTVTLPAQASELTGETVGDSSEFAADVPALIGAASFSGTIRAVEARGAWYDAVTFRVP